MDRIEQYDLSEEERIEALKLEEEKKRYAETVKKIKEITGMSDEEFLEMERKLKEDHRREAEENFGISN